MREEILQIYRKDLWKDKRLLNPQNDIFIKRADNIQERDNEISVLNFLNSYGIENVPDVIKTDGLNIHLPTLKGIRVFELLVQLDDLYINMGMSKAYEIKRIIIERCNIRQKKIQSALIDWRRTQSSRVPYPQYKIRSIIKVLAECTNLKYDYAAVEEEIDSICKYWETVANTPFRDAAVKNMVFMTDKLSRIEYSPSEEKYIVTRNLIQNLLNNTEFWINTPIGDFDFSSCVYDTTLEDDYIGLNYHERTYMGGNIEASSLLWHGSADEKRAAVSFLIRYYRFGGRKAAYRIINPINHMVRFRYDNDCFYFQHLNPIVKSIWPSASVEIPALLSLTEQFGKRLGSCKAYKDAFYERFPNLPKEPWAGMYEKPGS